MRKAEARSAAVAALVLLAACVLYCHRFYGVGFLLDGDALINTYFRLHASLLEADHNPHQLHYMSQWVPHVGRWNVLLRGVELAAGALFPGADPVARAVGVNMATAFLALWLFALSLALWFRWTGVSWPASVLGALVGALTGFPLVGVREFDHFYLLSAAAVAPTWIAHARLARGETPVLSAALGALPVGLSLLTGTNAPLFYFVPPLFLLPLLEWRGRQSVRAIARAWGLQAASLLLGAAIAAPVLWPALASLSEWNRSGLRFQGGLTPLDLPSLARSLFLRDWWITSGSHYHERDAFLGLPVLALAVVGALGRPATDRERRSLAWSVLFVAWGVAVACFVHWPPLLQRPFASFFEWQSIRYPNRFFFCAAIGFAWLAARGWDRLSDARLPAVVAALAVAQAALIGRSLSPVWSSLLPDSRRAAEIALASATLASLAWLLAGWRLRRDDERRGRILAATGIGAVFAMFAFAPQQLTLYANRYLARPSAIERLPPDRLAWGKVAGLALDYGHAVSHARALFLEAPPGLESPLTRRGRGMDRGESGGGALLLHAAGTGHEYAFTYARDPAAPWRLRALLALGNPALLDLAGVCWVTDSRWEDLLLRGPVAEPGPRPLPVLERPTCLPEAFLAEGFARHPDARSLATWLSRATRDELVARVGLDCSASPCGALPEAGPRARRSLTFVEKRPGRIVLDARGSGGALFLSIPFHSGWRARSGNRELPVLRADLAFLAVPLPPGTGHVELTFSPPGSRAAVGLAIASFTLAAAILLARLPWLSGAVARRLPESLRRALASATLAP